MSGKSDGPIVGAATVVVERAPSLRGNKALYNFDKVPKGANRYPTQLLVAADCKFFALL